MSNGTRMFVIGIACVALAAAHVRADGRRADEPLWAYGFLTPPGFADKAASPQPSPTRNLRPNENVVTQTRLRHMDGSSRAFSLVDTRDGHDVVDWFPTDHPSPLPDIIAHGPRGLGELAGGCGSCHQPNGRGRSENAQPGGLPLAYILRQLRDFRLGFRRSADWRKENTPTMIKLAMAMTDDEIKAAATYFSAIEWNAPWVRVVETDVVPKTRIGGNRFVPLEKTLTEPIAGRIIEVSEDDENVFHGEPPNPRKGWVAYVPVGSVARGEALVTTGGATVVGGEVVARKTLACTSCHGPDLMGDDDIPPLAGRSPSYMARQIYDIQQGTRNGAMTQLMKPVVANLTEQDMVAITAYIASRPPRHTAAARQGVLRTAAPSSRIVSSR